MRLALVFATALAFAQSTSALYFYLGAGEKRCFIEEIPKDTIVVGAFDSAAVPRRSLPEVDRPGNQRPSSSRARPIPPRITC